MSTSSTLAVPPTGAQNASRSKKDIKQPSQSPPASRKDSLTENVQPLKPTKDEVFAECDRFRILVLGKDDSGKIGLVNTVFGIRDAGDSPTSPETHSKILGTIPTENKRIAFYTAGIDDFEAVEQFVNAQQESTKSADKLHCIWICIKIPEEGEEALDASTEKLLDLAEKVPVVVVFTKFDMSVEVQTVTSLKRGRASNLAEIKVQARVLAEQDFERRCVPPYNEYLTRDQILRPVFVSIRAGFEDTLRELVLSTENQVRNFNRRANMFVKVIEKSNGIKTSDKTNGTNAPGTINKVKAPDKTEQIVTVKNDDTIRATFSAAQAFVPILKAKACVFTGRKHYWIRLDESKAFQGHSLENCIKVLHEDIIPFWNLRDPSTYLSEDHFRATIFKLADEVIFPKDSGRNRKLSVFAGALESAFSSPVIITHETYGKVALPNLYRKAYKPDTRSLQYLMTYVVELNNIMSGLFHKIRRGEKEVSKKLVDQVITSYRNWTLRDLVHDQAKDLAEKLTDIKTKNPLLDHPADMLEHLVLDYEYKNGK